jgi:hypothetical protein
MSNKKELGFETFRAEISNINETDRTFDVVIATEAPIYLEGWKYSESFEQFNEILECKPENIRAGRLEIGLPLFPSHWDRSSTDILGISKDYNVSDGKISATFRFGNRVDSTMISDIKEGILKTVSVGCNIYGVERFEDAENKITYHAVDWEPKHVAFAPEPADINCTIRSDAKIIGQSETKPEPEKQETDILKILLTK